MRAVCAPLAPALARDVPVVICAKGIELGTAALMSEVVRRELPGRPLAVLSGPTFAAEVARGLPTAVTLAGADRASASTSSMRWPPRHFRPYLSDDLIGAEIGGAVKNVHRYRLRHRRRPRLGDNGRAALITRGLAEITRLGVAKGARRRP